MDSNEVERTSPLHTSRFTVTIDGETISCASVSPPAASHPATTYRDGAGRVFRAPGVSGDLNMTMSRVLVAPRSPFWTWWKNSRAGQVEKKDITVNLTDEQGTAVFCSYNLKNVVPTDITLPSFDPDSATFAMEQISFTLESFDVAFADDEEK